MNKTVFLAVLLPLSMLLASCGEKNVPDNQDPTPNGQDTTSVKPKPEDTSLVKLSDLQLYAPYKQGELYQAYGEASIFNFAIDSVVSVDTSKEQSVTVYISGKHVDASSVTIYLTYSLSCTDGKNVKYAFETTDDHFKKVYKSDISYEVSKEKSLPELLAVTLSTTSEKVFTAEVTKEKGLTKFPISIDGSKMYDRIQKVK
mgnify:CR=1 FL=1